jgi:hypothetical protein
MKHSKVSIHRNRSFALGIAVVLALLSFSLADAQKICGSDPYFQSLLLKDTAFAKRQNQLEKSTAEFVNKEGS